MATDMTLLQGEITDEQDRQEMNIEKMLIGFLRSLLDEAAGKSPGPANTTNQESA